jgi:predicted RNase H-like nuclease (RuvC/YqgF family)
VEIPVEVIKEVEKIVEVPVEVIKEIIVEKEIIKEVPVEKIVTIYDNSSENELFGKIEQLEQNIFHLNEQIESERKIFSTKIEEMENNFQNTDNNKLQMLQKTITNLNVEIRDLKIKNKELENKLLEQPKESDFTKARFHGSSNLNDDLYK